VAPVVHAQTVAPNATDILDAGAAVIESGANATADAIGSVVDAVDNVTSTDLDFGACLRAIGDAWKCELNATCTCFANATGESYYHAILSWLYFIHCHSVPCLCHSPEKHNQADEFVATSDSCPDMTKEICDSIDYVKSCCPSCEATFARLSLCNGKDYFAKTNCKSAEACLDEGLASAGFRTQTQIGLWSAVIATATAALVFWI
jgi:hypothetical protein